MYMLKQNSEETLCECKQDNESEMSTQTLQTVALPESTLVPQKLQLKKMIAKLKKTKSKQYKKKELFIQPLIYKSLEIYHQYILFGNIEIETYYKDYATQWEVNLVSLKERTVRINQIEKKMNEQQLEIYLEPLGISGLKEFQFLIDHFSRFQNQNYRELVQKLKEYQIQTDCIVKQLSHINDKIKSRIISEEEVQKAFDDYEVYFKNYVKTNYKESDFIASRIVTLDFKTQDIQQKRIHLSFAMLSLLGLEQEDIEQKLLRSQERLQNTLRCLLFFNKDIQYLSYYGNHFTADQLNFQSTTQVEVVHWPNAPEWMPKFTSFGIIQKLDLSLNQLKSIIEIRSKQTEENMRIFGDQLHDTFEYSIQSEIFLEKFYPELYKNPSSKKSIKLKKSNPQVQI